MATPKARVLAVEDNASLALLMQRALQPEGVEVTVASSGEQGLGLARRQRFDLIILNINLPGITGLQVCQQLKLDPALKDIPVLFASGETSRLFVDEAFRLGAVDFLPKPFALQEFTACVLAHLGLAGSDSASAELRLQARQKSLRASAALRPGGVPMELARILYVEDLPAVAGLVQLELEQARLSVTTAASGERALALAHEHKFDLILLDLWLPGMNGLEVCRRLKSDPGLAEIPVIFFTAYPSLAQQHEASRLGAVDYLQKGVLAPRLAARILAEVELARDRTSRRSKKAASDTPASKPAPPGGPVTQA